MFRTNLMSKNRILIFSVNLQKRRNGKAGNQHKAF